MTDLADQNDRLYAKPFFLLLATLFAFMCGFSMLVHLPKYIVEHGGDIGTVSWIFGFGMTGSLLTRPFVGRWLDRAGCKPVLLAATGLAAIAIVSFQWFASVGATSVLRVAVQLSQAAFLAAVAVYATKIAPSGRSAESLAMVGAGGLAGLMTGPILGDRIFAAAPDAYATFFTLAGALILAGLLIGLTIPSPAPSTSAERATHSVFRLVVRYWPGPLIAVALCLAFVQTVPIMFIERFAASRNMSGVTVFFAAYAPTAIVLRIVLRRLPQRIGRRRTLVFGMSCYALGLLLLVRTHTDLGLILPAIVMGTGHCFSYPFLVDLAAERMPVQHRGVAITAILGVSDAGFLMAFIVEGQLVKHYGFGPTLTAVAIGAGICTCYYAWSQRRTERPGGTSRQ